MIEVPASCAEISRLAVALYRCSTLADVERTRFPIGVLVFGAMMTIGGSVILIVERSVLGLGLVAFGLWCLLAVLALDARSPPGDRGRAVAMLIGGIASVICGTSFVLDAESIAASSPRLTPSSAAVLGVVFAVFFGAAGITGFVKIWKTR